mgnify:CR=1 FL=1
MTETTALCELEQEIEREVRKNMFDLWTKREIKMLAALVVCAVLLVSTLLYVFIITDDRRIAQDNLPLQEVTEGEGLIPAETDSGMLQQQDESTVQPEEIVVDVKGAVRQPGIYHLSAGARLYQAIEAAGGTTEEADETLLNLAEFLTDGMAVIVPVKGEDPHELLQMTAGAGGDSSNGGKVNVNRATEAELQTLTGIGPSKAAAIVRDREENGPYETVDELTRVSGIGEKTLENIRADITVR